MANFAEDFAQILIDEDCEIEIISHQQKTFGFIDDNVEKNYQASVLGLRDYVRKNNFHKIILGMSGGIDSALVATIAVDALGSENVELYALPTKFNSQSSLDDAKLCAKNLNVALKIIEIEEIFQTNLATIKSQENLSSLAEENLQSRIRGNILMAISNSKNALLLSTGNKSEMACGYATLYGDMNGAFNPIKDFYKSEIYQLANFRNQNLCKISAFKNINLIPQNIIDKAPSAELRFDQKDSDSLPDYNELDKILYALIEEQKSIDETINLGFEAEIVKKVAKLVLLSEYKRKQAVLGVKISQLSFDKDRRYPITNKFMF
jgi:NAD+ synthase